ncbi:MAG: type II secretion system protein N [Magnetococcus sp. DMHC-1]
MMILFRKWWFYGIISVVSFLFFLFANLPASFVYQMAKAKIAPIQLNGISGTLWSGRAIQLIYPPVQLDSLQWTIRPKAILKGKIQGLFYIGNSKQFRIRGRFDVQDQNHVRFQQITGNTSIPFLTDLLKDFPLQMKGEIDLGMDDFMMRANGFPEITGRIDIRGLELGPPWKVFLGDVRLLSSMENDMINIQINDIRSSLTMNVTLQIWEAGRYRLHGNVEVQSGENKQAMENFLQQSVGLNGNNGHFPLNMTGTIPFFR